MYQKIAVKNRKTPPKKAGSFYDRHKKEYYVIFFLLVFTLLKFSGLDNVIMAVLYAFVPLILGISIAFVLTPIIDFFHNKGIRRGLAKIITLGVSTIIAGLALALIVPYLVDQVSIFITGMLGDRHLAETLAMIFEKTDFGRDAINFANPFAMFADGSLAISETLFPGWEDSIKGLSDIEVWIASLPDVSAPGTSWEWTIAGWDWTGADGAQTYLANTLFTHTNASGVEISGSGVASIGALYKLGMMFMESLGTTGAGTMGGYIVAVFDVTDFSQYGNVAVGFLGLAGGLVFTLMMSVVIAFFLLDSYKGLMHWITTHAIPDTKHDREEVAHAIHGSITSWIKGVSVDFVIMFSMTAAILFVAGIMTDTPGQTIKFKEAAMMYGLLMAICNLIPLIGPFIGMVPIGLAGLLIYSETGDITPFVFTIVGATVIQILESNVLIPMIYGKTAQLHPITILIGISVFGAAFGLLGMFLTIPLLSTIKAVGFVKGYKINI